MLFYSDVKLTYSDKFLNEYKKDLKNITHNLNMCNDRILEKLEEFRDDKDDSDYFKNINNVLVGMVTNKTSNKENYKAFISYSSEYVEMLHDFSLLKNSRKWRHSRYVGKYKVIFV